MYKLITLVKYLCELSDGENDYVDRLNYHATSKILVFSAACIFAKVLSSIFILFYLIAHLIHAHFSHSFRRRTNSMLE